MAFEPGYRFGRYQIKSQLGQGGMGTVYLALDTHREHDIALKVLPNALLREAGFRERFANEARTIIQLEHHAIVPVYDFGEEDGQPFIAMRLMSGGSLQERLRQGPLTLDETSTIMQRICAALDRAHQQNIIHRDLKPGNILFDRDDQAYLADFGIARLAEGSHTVTMIGTPQYMAPEQAHGLPLDARTDVYQMGVVLFEMLTGAVPYDAPTPISLLFKHSNDPVPLVREHNQGLPPTIEQIVQCAMAKEPDSRYASAGALAADVTALTVGQPVSAATIVPPVNLSAESTVLVSAETNPQAQPRVPLWMTLLGIFALILLTGTITLFVLRDNDEQVAIDPAAISAELDSSGSGSEPTATPDGRDEPDDRAEIIAPVPTDTPPPAATDTPQPTDTIAPTPTWTPLPTTTPTLAPIPTPTSISANCPTVTGTFANVWQQVRDDIGCSTGNAGVGLIASEDFVDGKMIWRESYDVAQALLLLDNGSWWVEYHTPFVEGTDEFTCTDDNTPAQCPPTPKRGFGSIWCDNSGVRANLGNALTCEVGFNESMQPFDNGFMLRGNDGATYVLYGTTSGWWERR